VLVLVLAVGVVLWFATDQTPVPVPATAAAMVESDGYRLVGIYDRRWFSDHDGPDLARYLAPGPGAAALGAADDGSSEIVLRLRDEAAVRLIRAQLRAIVREVGAGTTGYVDGPYLVLDEAPRPPPGP